MTRLALLSRIGFPRDATVVVTGACGLVGQRLVQSLRGAGVRVRGADLRAPDGILPPDLESVTGDLRDPTICACACEDAAAVVHTAGVQYGDGVPWLGRAGGFRPNEQLARSLCEAAASAGVRQVVFLSSDMVYGLPRGRAVRESDDPRPLGPYGRSKLAAERILADAHGLCVTILRPRLILGPGRLGALKRLFERIEANRPIPILGDGRNRYQMIHVDDVVQACCLALERPQAGVFNLGSTDPPRVRDLLLSLCERAQSRSQLRALPAWPARIALHALDWLGLSPLAPEQFRIAHADYVLDTTRMREVYGWSPRHADVESLCEAYDAYRSSRAPAMAAAGACPGAAACEDVRAAAESAAASSHAAVADRD